MLYPLRKSRGEVIGLNLITSDIAPLMARAKGMSYSIELDKLSACWELIDQNTKTIVSSVSFLTITKDGAKEQLFDFFFYHLYYDTTLWIDTMDEFSGEIPRILAESQDTITRIDTDSDSAEYGEQRAFETENVLRYQKWFDRLALAVLTSPEPYWTTDEDS